VSVLGADPGGQQVRADSTTGQPADDATTAPELPYAVQFHAAESAPVKNAKSFWPPIATGLTWVVVPLAWCTTMRTADGGAAPTLTCSVPPLAESRVMVGS
jgi:hypothetical protein